MNTKTAFASLIIALALLAPGYGVSAQSESMQKALQSVKGAIDDLATAKDEQQPVELGLRIEALKKAIDLSATEAKDLRVKLLALDDGLGAATGTWRLAMADEMKKAADKAIEEKDAIEAKGKDITLDEVKEAATRFKEWRDASYLPVVTQIRDYFLIAQEEKTIETAKNRWQKIESDIKKLEKAKIKNIESARKMLTSADFLIAAGETLNQEAKDMFAASYLATSTKAKEPDAATSTENSATSTINESSPAASSSETGLGATSSSSTLRDSFPLPPPPSIRDLVGQSLSKIKDAYKVFIDMSNLVRKLLK